jgi:Family of unknown function (DUF7003)
MDTQRILEDLDKHAAEFNFPVVDNAYVALAAARLSAFRNQGHWLIIFEVLGFSEREIEFVNDYYAYGSCTPKSGFIGEEVPVRNSRENPVFDRKTNECIADWNRWSISVDGKEMTFSPIPEEYARAGIVIEGPAGRGTLSEIDMLRFLVYRLGCDRFFMSESVLLGHFPGCRDVTKFLQSTSWQHPDIASGERPSQNVSIRSLVKALSEGDPFLFDPGVPNTHWQFWAPAGGPSLTP